MKFGSTFTGIGGFDLGFERAGMECVWQIEIDKDCQRVLAKHFPKTERLQDVSVAGKLPAVDVICGGFPCQDLSVAGKRAGLAGERSGLWFEFLRIIESNLPRWIVIENVPGLLSSDEGRDFAAILRGLVECGYCLAWRIVDAQYNGVAQRRRRVFIVGSLGDGSCAEILFESESVSWNPPTRREAGPGVTPILEAGARTNGDGRRDGDGIGVEGDPMFTLQRGNQHAVAATLDQRGRGPTDAVMMNLQVSMPLKAKANSSHDESHETYVTHALSSEGALRAQNFKDSHMNGVGQVAIAFDHCLQGSERTFIHRKNGQAQLQANRPDAVAGSFGVRRLTPTECERLQGFPDLWTAVDAEGKEISDSARYRMLGNAVPVPVAEWISRRIMKVANQ